MGELGFEPGPELGDSALKGSTRLSPQVVAWGRGWVVGVWVTLRRVTLHSLIYPYLTLSVSTMFSNKALAISWCTFPPEKTTLISLILQDSSSLSLTAPAA